VQDAQPHDCSQTEAWLQDHQGIMMGRHRTLTHAAARQQHNADSMFESGLLCKTPLATR
jgi:hypothetical protein